MTEEESRTAPKLSVVILALNEADWIEPTYQALADALLTFDGTVEILLFDDGSTDQTPERMSDIARQDERVRVLTHRHNMGIGEGIRDSVRAAHGDFIFILPGDHSYSSEAINAVLDKCGSADVVSGWRLDTGAVSPLRRRISQLVELNLRFYSGGAQIKAGGSNLYKASILRESLGKSTGYLFGFETVAHISMHHPTVARVWVEQLPKSGGRSASVKARYVLEMFQVNARLLRIRLGGQRRERHRSRAEVGR